MALFFPEWIPWWVQLIMVAVVVIFGFCFLLMPFAVFGLKSRLTYLDHQMEDIQSQLRVLLKRIPDARERLEFKLQPIATGENEGIREGNFNRGEGSSRPSSEYYAAIPSTKSRPTRFDPPAQPAQTERPTQVNTVTEKTTAPGDIQQHSDQDRSRERESPMSGQEPRTVHTSKREEQLYDPPSKPPVRDERQEGSQRRRAEPILRWPPR